MGQQERPVINALFLFTSYDNTNLARRKTWCDFDSSPFWKFETTRRIAFEHRGAGIGRDRTRAILHATSHGRVSGISCDVGETVQRVDGVLVIDAEATCDSMYGASGPPIEMMGFQEGMKRQDAILRWCHGEAKFSVGQTKETSKTQLELFYGDGCVWSLVHDEEIVSARKRRQQGKQPLMKKQHVQNETWTKTGLKIGCPRGHVRHGLCCFGIELCV